MLFASSLTQSRPSFTVAWTCLGHEAFTVALFMHAHWSAQTDVFLYLSVATLPNFLTKTAVHVAQLLSSCEGIGKLDAKHRAQAAAEQQAALDSFNHRDEEEAEVVDKDDDDDEQTERSEQATSTPKARSRSPPRRRSTSVTRRRSRSRART